MSVILNHFQLGQNNAPKFHQDQIVGDGILDQH